MHHDSGLEANLREIRQRFQETLPGRAEKVVELWDALQKGWCDELAGSMFAEIHRLSGSCGCLGFANIGEIACELDGFVRSALEEHRLPCSETQQRITELVTLLAGHCSQR